MSDGNLARTFTKNNVNTFRNSYLQSRNNSSGQVALGHLRKVHDAMKRRSGEGLAAIAPDKNAELLAVQRAQLLGEKLPVIAAPKKRIPLPVQNASELALIPFPDTGMSSDDTSDDEPLFLQPKPAKREPELVKRLPEPAKPQQLVPAKRKSIAQDPPAKHSIVEFHAERMTAIKALMKQQAYFQEIQAKQQNDFLNLMKSVLQAPITE